VPADLEETYEAEAARLLAGASAEPLVVAQQLLASGRPGGNWARGWLIEAAPVFAMRAPQLALDLLQRELDDVQVRDCTRVLLLVTLARILLQLGRAAEGVVRARQALVVAADPASRAEICWWLARGLFSMRSNEEGLDIVGRGLHIYEIPGMWRARLLASRAMLQRASNGDLDAADLSARQALQAGEEAGDAFAVAYALASLCLSNSVRRDHIAALDCIGQALDALGDGADHADLRAFILDGKISAMQNLDRWPDAQAALQQARGQAQHHRPRSAASSVTAAVLMYWLGRWDDALAELSAIDEDHAEITYSGLREPALTLLRHGVAALIALRRDGRQLAAGSLSAGLAIPIQTIADQENSDFLAVAHALAAEQDGDPLRALSILSTFLGRRAEEMTLVHQWLPDVVRLALSAGDQQIVLAEDLAVVLANRGKGR
jgi:tetratricopeptide (TPR) repeat protein